MNVSQNVIADNNPIKQDEQKPEVRKAIVFTIVSLALLMITVDGTIVATALHTLQHELHTTINWASWTLTAYSFGFVLMLPITGKFCERYGNRRIFLFSIGTFTTASIFCGLSNNIYFLIAFRVLQSAGGAGITPSVTGIIVNHFGKSRDRAVSMFGSIFPIGAMIGPIFGGLFVTYLTWRDIFFVNVPIGIAVILLSLKYIPGDPAMNKNLRPKKDNIGVILLGTGLLSCMFAASYLGGKKAELISPLFLMLLAIAIVTFVIFFRHINHSQNPLISPQFITGKGFGAVNLINIMLGGITQGVIALVPLYATNRYGINALNSGTLLVAEGVAAITFSTLFTMLLRRTGYRPPLYFGCITIVIGTALLAINPIADISPYLWLMVATFLIGIGAGAINPSCRNAGLQLAPEHSSIIASLRSMCLQIGSIVTISVATAVISGSKGNGNSQADVYIVIAILLLASIPYIKRIPEHHGSW